MAKQRYRSLAEVIGHGMVNVLAVCTYRLLKTACALEALHSTRLVIRTDNELEMAAARLLRARGYLFQTDETGGCAYYGISDAGIRAFRRAKRRGR